MSEKTMFSQLVNQFGFLGLGGTELLLILLIVLLLFGGRKLPDLARSVGTSMQELRKGLGEDGEKQKSGNKTKPKSE